METKNLIGIVIVALLIASIVVSIVWISKSNSNTTPTGAGSYEGFSSYEEMMEAHHGGQQATNTDGCGGVSTASGGSIVSYLGEESEYGITYDDNGYNKLVGAAKTVELSKEQTKSIVGLDVELPCCEVKTLRAEGNCECGHHVALYGLAKLLASEGYSREKIQEEIEKWKVVFFPEGGAGNTGGC